MKTARPPKRKGSRKRRPASGLAKGYLHGYSPEEQERLYRQARFLAPTVYEHIDFGGRSRLLEVGCGVGAQTEILLEKFPQLAIQGIDASPQQIEAARKRLSGPIASGRVKLAVGDALKMPFPDRSFDSAFFCWLLEHVADPVGILRETRRKLAPGAVVYCSEVLNATFYVHPYSPNTLRYWFAFNDHQWNMKGDPFVGAKLANYLLAAGYKDVTTEAKVYHYDNRSREQRARFIEYWTSLLLSGAPGLLKAGKVTSRVISGMKKELALLKDEPDAVFFYTFIQARAVAP